MKKLLLWAPATLLAFAACRPTHSDTVLREHMATVPEDEQERARIGFDLQCPADGIEVVPLDSMSFGARGCGRQLRYQKACHRCQWTPVATASDLLTE